MRKSIWYKSSWNSATNVKLAAVFVSQTQTFNSVWCCSLFKKVAKSDVDKKASLVFWIKKNTTDGVSLPQPLLTARFFPSIFVAGWGRWWSEPPWWCTWSLRSPSPLTPPSKDPGVLPGSWFRPVGSSPFEKKKGCVGLKRQRFLCYNSPDYSCLPSWLWLMIGEISTED